MKLLLCCIFALSEEGINRGGCSTEVGRNAVSRVRFKCQDSRLLFALSDGTLQAEICFEKRYNTIRISKSFTHLGKSG